MKIAMRTYLWLLVFLLVAVVGGIIVSDKLDGRHDVNNGNGDELRTSSIFDYNKKIGHGVNIGMPLRHPLKVLGGFTYRMIIFLSSRNVALILYVFPFAGQLTSKIIIRTR